MVSISQCAAYVTVPVEQGVLALFKPDKAAGRVRHQEQFSRSGGGRMAHTWFLKAMFIQK